MFAYDPLSHLSRCPIACHRALSQKQPAAPEPEAPVQPKALPPPPLPAQPQPAKFSAEKRAKLREALQGLIEKDEFVDMLGAELAKVGLLS